METYSLQPTIFMYFWLNYCDENHVERIPTAVKNWQIKLALTCEGSFEFFLVFSPRV